jgi:tetratricopeptide (TPR) repeat protein
MSTRNEHPRTFRQLAGLLLVTAIVLAGCSAQNAIGQTPVAPTPQPTASGAPVAPAATVTARPASQGAGPEKPAAGLAPTNQPATGTGSVADHLRAGKTAADTGDTARAEQEFKAALSIDATSAEAQLSLGNLYFRQNRLAEAEVAYKRAVDLDPRLLAARTNLGVIYYQLGQFPQAIEQYRAGLGISPNDAESMYLLAVVYIQQNNLTDAEQLLQQAQRAKPGLAEVYYGLGTLYKLKGDKPDAIANFEKFLELGKTAQDPAAIEHARAQLDELKK